MLILLVVPQASPAVKWLQKLKDDQQTADAGIAAIVTTAMPKWLAESFCRIGDIWVVSPEVMRPVAETLRVILLEAQRLKLVNTGRNEKMEQLYNYLSSAQFAQRVRTMLEGFESMRSASWIWKAGHAKNVG